MRLWLAKKLAPEVFKDADRFDYLRRRLEEIRTWCGYEFPLVEKAVHWAQRSTLVHFLPYSEWNELIRTGKYDEVAVGRIDGFREELRRERDTNAPSDQRGPA